MTDQSARLVKRLDLTAFSEHYRKRPPYKKLAHLIKRTVDANSAQADLKMAQQKMEIAARERRDTPVVVIEAQDGEQGSWMGSLYAHSVILYARATHTGNDDRDFIPITKGWDDTSLRRHKNLILLRNSVIAHFGYARDHIDGSWANDRIYLDMLGDGSGRIVSFFDRVNYRQNSVEDLLHCLDLAIPRIAEIYAERSNMMQQEMDVLLIKDGPALATALSAFEAAADKSAFAPDIIPGDHVTWTTLEPPIIRG